MAYKTFANGFPLPASDLNNFLMNQSVIVFADSAARGTAIPSPVTGMLTYLVDTAAYESWNGSAFVPIVEDSPITTEGDLITGDASGDPSRIGIGSTDQVLTVASGVPTWADAAGGGGIQLISSTTLSGSSTTISSIPSTYKNIIIQVVGLDLLADQHLDIDIKAGANVLVIRGSYLRRVGSTVTTNSATSLRNVGTDVLRANTDNFFTYTIENYAFSNNQSKVVTGSQTYRDKNSELTAAWLNLGFFDNPTGAIDSIVARTTSSFNGGTFRIYGVN